jgi:hypothetical protein
MGLETKAQHIELFDGDRVPLGARHSVGRGTLRQRGRQGCPSLTKLTGSPKACGYFRSSLLR